MDIEIEVRKMLRDVLSLGARTDTLSRESPLLGALPEMDSMAVVNVIAAIEDRFDVVVEDDEITGDVFSTLGTLVEFVAMKTNVH